MMECQRALVHMATGKRQLPVVSPMLVCRGWLHCWKVLHRTPRLKVTTITMLMTKKTARNVSHSMVMLIHGRKWKPCPSLCPPAHHCLRSLGKARSHRIGLVQASLVLCVPTLADLLQTKNFNGNTFKLSPCLHTSSLPQNILPINLEIDCYLFIICFLFKLNTHLFPVKKMYK